jgi:PAT family beta-lactamase induction signal transducer AmpG
VVVGLLAMAALTPTKLLPFVLATLAVAFFGATQDIAVDAYRIEIAPLQAQAALAATYTLGYRFGLIVAGAGALYLAAAAGWRAAYLCMAAALLLPLAATLLAREPVASKVRVRPDFAEAFLGPFADFLRRYGVAVAAALLVFIGLFKLPDQMLGVIAGPFYIDAGYSKEQIATVSKLYGIWIGIGGAFLGGMSVAALGLRRSIVLAALGLALSNLLYLLMTANPGQSWAFVTAISGDNAALGFAGVVLVAFLSSLTSSEFTATQYALLVSFANMPGKLLGGVSGFLVESWGYDGFFIFSTLSVVPTLALWWWLARRPQVLQPPVVSAASAL